MHCTHGGKARLAVVAGVVWPHLLPSRRDIEKPLAEKETTMFTMIQTLKTAAANRALYRRTRDEIASLPRDIALDIGIFPEDADQIARHMVYGR
jgi:uncharacterized protein YjiS (DUF1127 family)